MDDLVVKGFDGGLFYDLIFVVGVRCGNFVVLGFGVVDNEFY